MTKIIQPREVPNKRIGWVAFRDGRLVPDNTLRWIIEAAKRGKITEAGKQLMLVPDTRHGPADAGGLREMSRVRRSDCIPLTSLCPLGKRTTPTRSVAEFRTETIEKLDLKPTAGAASSASKTPSEPLPQ